MNGNIVRVEGPWDRFAGDNNGRSILNAGILNRNLFEFISGYSVKAIYQAMHDLLLHKTNTQIQFQYRCDAPDRKRFMRMHLQRHNDLIEYRSIIDREEPLDPPVVIDYTSETGETVVLCSWCKRFRHPENAQEWKALETLFETVPEPFSVTHSICPACSAEFWNQHKEHQKTLS